MAEFIINHTIKVTAEPADPGDEPLHTVSYAFYYPVKHEAPIISGTINTSAPVKLDYQAATGSFSIHGTLQLIASDRECVLTADFYYGMHEQIGLQDHFEGTLAIFPIE